LKGCIPHSKALLSGKVEIFGNFMPDSNYRIHPYSYSSLSFLVHSLFEDYLNGQIRKWQAFSSPMKIISEVTSPFGLPKLSAF
jgi:hypothetical protein